MAASFDIGDLVWGKMRSFPAWPAQIVDPSAKPDIKKPTKKNVEHHLLYFFGADNYAWLQEDIVFPYEQMKEKFTKLSRTPRGFNDAVTMTDEIAKTLPPKPQVPELPTIDDELKQIFSDDDATNSSKSKTPKSIGRPRKIQRSKSDDDTPLSLLKKTKIATPASASARKRPLLNKREPVASKKAKLLVKLQNTEKDAKPRRQSLPNKRHTNLKVMPRPSLPNDKPKYMPQSPITHNRSTSASTQMDDCASPTTKRAIIPTPMRIGFLGLGIMGQGIVMNLMRSGHEVMVWNRTSAKCRDFVYDGALKGNTPSDVIQACDITFACVADPNASRDLVFGNSGVLQEIKPGKSYVEMTTVDVDTVEEINEAITQRGGRFLEAPVVGSRVPAVEGELIILAAGDKELCDDCYSCFEAMGKKTMFLGEVGSATRMKLIINMIIGTTMASIAEGMALAEKTGLDQEDVAVVLGMSSVASELVKHKTSAIINNKYEAHLPLMHQQKDLRLACLLGDIVEQPLYLASVANELYKKARRFGYGESDISAVYRAANA